MADSTRSATPPNPTFPDLPLSELPLWMRAAQQGIDWGVLIVVFFSFLVAWAFVVQEGLPHNNASENYVYMTANYAEALREGHLYPRWNPAASNGYGAPIPHYYPPGAPYSAALIEVLLSSTADSVTAVRVIYIISLTLAGTMTYAFVMRQAGATAGVLAGILYVYSPYVGLVAPHILGDLPGVMSLVLLPTLLWATHRLIRVNRAFDFGAVVLVTAALLVTDVRMAIVSVILAVALIWQLLAGFRAKSRSVVAILTGIAIASFFWMPALLEQNLVTWRPPPFDRFPYRLTLGQLIAIPRRLDLGQLKIAPQLTLGLGVIVFITIGALSILLNHKRSGFYALFLVLGAFFAGAGLLIFPQEIWLLGPVTFCWSVAGSGALLLRQKLPGDAQRLMLPVALIFIMMAALPVWLSPRWSPSFGDTGVPEQIQYEQLGFGVAAQPPGAESPVTVARNTPLDSTLLSSYQTGVAVRIPQTQLGLGRQASLIRSDSHSDSYIINASQSVTFNILRAYFKGWQATVGGVSLDVFPDEATGLLQVQVPPVNDQRLIISLGTTPVRRIAWIISGVLLAVIAIRTVRRLRSQSTLFHDDLILLDLAETRLLLVFSVGFAIIIFLFATPDSPYTLHARPGYMLDNTYDLRSRTSSGLEAVSYAIDHVNYNSGDSIHVVIAWRSPRPLLRNYSVQVFLQDTGQGLARGRTEPRYPGGYPTRRWGTNGYIRDDYTIEVGSSVLPGDYVIGVEVYDCIPTCDPDNRLQFFSADGTLIGPRLTLPPVIRVDE